jgi:hypothetical protein
VKTYYLVGPTRSVEQQDSCRKFTFWSQLLQGTFHQAKPLQDMSRISLQIISEKDPFPSTFLDSRYTRKKSVMRQKLSWTEPCKIRVLGYNQKV